MAYEENIEQFRSKEVTTMGEIFVIVLYIALLIFCIGLFLFLLGGSLFVGAVGGFFIGIFKGFKNYFSALAENLKLRE